MQVQALPLFSLLKGFLVNPNLFIGSLTSYLQLVVCLEVEALVCSLKGYLFRPLGMGEANAVLRPALPEGNSGRIL